MSMNSVAQVKEQQTLDFVGTEQNGVYRPTFSLANLNVSKVDKSNIEDDGYCDFLRIPLISKADEVLSYQQMFCYLVDKVVCGFNDVFPQPEDLFLVVDDSDGERQYYIGADVQVKNWDGVNTETSIEKIHPSDDEKAIVELALLKITDPEEYLRRYTRYQIAQLPQIVNAKLGFVIDNIRNDDLYASVWLSQDHKTCVLACVENVHEPNSKIQLLKVG
jgi:hypothetical protein